MKSIIKLTSEAGNVYFFTYLPGTLDSITLTPCYAEEFPTNTDAVQALGAIEGVLHKFVKIEIVRVP